MLPHSPDRFLGSLRVVSAYYAFDKVNEFVQQKAWKRPASPTTASHHYARIPSREQRAAVQVPTPDVVTIDELSMLTDEELYGRQKMLGTARSGLLYGHNAVTQDEDDVRRWDEEIAYVAREIQIRHARRAAHVAYVRQCEIDFNLEEARAPVADLDNTGFLRSIGMLN